MRILVFNSGSSSLKFQLFDVGDCPVSVLRGAVTNIGPGASLDWRYGERSGQERLAAPDHAAAAHRILALLSGDAITGVPLLTSLAAIGHRIVHGGEQFHTPVRVTAEVRAALDSLGSLAPLHNPPALSVLSSCVQQLCDIPNVAVFDTTFFHDLPDQARLYALPAEWVKAYGLRRYGFHGIAHRWLHERVLKLSGLPRSARVITLQLGHGCSLAAIRDGRPVDTSMGFTPLEGLIMATRGGDVDPGILLHLSALGLSPIDLRDGLNLRSGLLGLSGASGDMRELLELERNGHIGAKLAVDAFCHRARKYLGAYLAVLGGADAVVFGGGIGEHAPAIRARICADMRWSGLALDGAANLDCVGKDRRISEPASSMVVYALAVDEESLIARDVHSCF